MIQLTFEGFLFVMFWGCALWMVAALIVWVWEVVAERVQRRRFWRDLAERNRGWVDREWSDE